MFWGSWKNRAAAVGKWVVQSLDSAVHMLKYLWERYWTPYISPMYSWVCMIEKKHCRDGKKDLDSSRVSSVDYKKNWTSSLWCHPLVWVALRVVFLLLRSGMLQMSKRNRKNTFSLVKVNHFCPAEVCLERSWKYCGSWLHWLSHIGGTAEMLVNICNAIFLKCCFGGDIKKELMLGECKLPVTFYLYN